ncbi:MAG TPA: hypothetical protein VEP50_09055 [bacterium]|nr:hypothetical protein [bacterium]
MKRSLLALIAVVAVLGVYRVSAAPRAPHSALSVLVTGDPAPIETLRRGVVTAVRALLPPAPHAQMELFWVNPSFAPLPAGRSVTMNAGFLIAAPGRPPLSFAMPVTLTNTPLNWRAAHELLVSDDPETIDKSGVLNAMTIQPSQAVRLLYHHQNGSRDRDMAFAVKLTNPGPFAATLLVTAADGGPTPNELLAGHTAARWFLSQYWHHAGFLLVLPSMTSFVLSEATVPPQDVVSGVDQIALQSGRSVRLEVVSTFPDGSERISLREGAQFELEPSWPGFLNPVIFRVTSYTVGNVATLTFGGPDDLLHAQEAGTTLLGNYGVIYSFAVAMANPTAGPMRAVLVMHADSGQAQGTFLVDGHVVEGPIVQPNAPRVITTFDLPPLSRRVVELSTMPESGSCYPVWLTIGPR